MTTIDRTALRARASSPTARVRAALARPATTWRTPDEARRATYDAIIDGIGPILDRLDAAERLLGEAGADGRSRT